MLSVQWEMAARGDLRKLPAAVADAHTRAIRSATTRLKNQGRRQLSRAGLARLAPAWRGEVRSASGADITRRGQDADPTGVVYSKAIRKGSPGGAVDLIDVFETGATIRARGGQYTAIPTAAAGGRRAVPISAHSAGTFRLVPVGRKPGRLRRGGVRVAFVAVHRETGAVWYLLVPSFQLRRRLRLGPAYARIAATVPASVDRFYARALVRLGIA